MIATGRPVAAPRTPARRPQPTGPELAGQRRIRRGRTRADELVEQRRSPTDAGPRPAARGSSRRTGRTDPLARLRTPGSRFAVQIGPDRLAVMAEMAGDRGDRPALPAERVDVHIVLPCEHENGAPSTLVVVRDHQHRGSPAPRGGATRVGNFSEHQWGISVSAIILSQSEVEQLAEAMDDRHRALVLVGAFAGLRWGEAAGLTRENVDVLRSRIRVASTAVEVRGHVTLVNEPKTRRSKRTVPVARSVMRQLEEHLARFVGPEPDALVFTAPRAAAGVDPCSPAESWQPAVKRVGFARDHVPRPAAQLRGDPGGGRLQRP